MASTNLELARSIWASWEKGDFSPVDWAHPDIEFVQADLPESEPRQLDEERVLVLGTFRGRGKHSGVDVGQVEMQGVMVFHIRAGKVVKIITYYSRARGLASSGFSSVEALRYELPYSS